MSRAISSCRGDVTKGKQCEQSREEPRRHCCRHKHRVARWAFLGAGIGSLMWFLVRVIPKPSRAAYPCQRAAAPFASAFVVWLLAVLGARWAMVRRREFARQARMSAAWACSGVFLVCLALGLRSVPEHPGYAGPTPHAPLGMA